MRDFIFEKALAYTVNVPIARDENGNWKTEYDSFNGYFLDLIRVAITIGSMLAVLMIIFGAIKYSTSGGDESKAKDGKDIIVGALVGLALLLLTRVLIGLLGIE